MKRTSRRPKRNSRRGEERVRSIVIEVLDREGRSEAVRVFKRAGLKPQQHYTYFAQGKAGPGSLARYQLYVMPAEGTRFWSAVAEVRGEVGQRLGLDIYE